MYYQRIFTHGYEFVSKFNITYGHYPQTTLPTDITHKYESIGKFSITYQLLPIKLYYLPTIIHESQLPTNYYPKISITNQLLSTNLNYLSTIIHGSLLPINYYHNNYIHNIKNIIIK